MRRIEVLILAAVCSTPAFAMHCPSKMAEIDSMLETNPPTDSALRLQVIALRAEGEELHKAGDHAQSSEVLSEAIALLESAE